MTAKTLLLIHHTHTDIGYTEQQQRIERWQVDFIRQAMAIVRRHRSGDDPFRWVCECFRAVEQFIQQADPEEAAEFVQMLKHDEIGLSANYLNFNELPGLELQQKLIGRAVLFADKNQVPLDSAMTADINGFGPGFARALLDNDVKNLFTCIHTHHGMYPLGKTQVPFWWETAQGDRLLVWSGEHYHFGNDLGLVPGAVASYQIKDECDATMIFGDNRAVAEIRIPRYFEQLASTGYDLDFVPVMASGLRTDNGPPCEGIVEFLEEWNQKNGSNIRIEMTTLDGFFARLRAAKTEIPVYRGDWPDWWSDGPASTPAEVRLFRQAQRDWRTYRQVLKSRPEIKPQKTTDLETQLALFAEHTFSHSASVSAPWLPLAQSIPAVKTSFAAQAFELSQALLDDAALQLGATNLSATMPLRYRALNPGPERRCAPIRLPVNHFEFNEKGFNHGVQVVDLVTGQTVPCRLEIEPRGGNYCAVVELDPGETRDYQVMALDPEVQADGDPPGWERWEDCEGKEGVLETEYARLQWKMDDGLVSWVDKTSGRELLRADRHHNAFTLVHEITRPEADQDMMSVRSAMGLNRKGENVERQASRLVRVRQNPDSAVHSDLLLDYEVSGVGLCTLELHAWHHAPRVDLALRLHKLSCWEPENLYLSLPFENQNLGLSLDRAGQAIHPGRDQIPGTLTDYYSVQGGFALTGHDFGLCVAMPDQNLLQVGPLEFGERLLAGDPRLAKDPQRLYGWLMTNYWETNFSAQLGGFHEFRYRVAWGPHLNHPARALAEGENLVQDFLCFRLGS